MNFWIGFNDESIKLENLPEYIHEKDELKVETVSEIVRCRLGVDKVWWVGFSSTFKLY